MSEKKEDPMELLKPSKETPKGYFGSIGSSSKLDACFVTVSSKVEKDKKGQAQLRAAIAHAIKQGYNTFLMGVYGADKLAKQIAEELGAKVKCVPCGSDKDDPEIWVEFGPADPKWGKTSLERDLRLQMQAGAFISVFPRNSQASNPGTLVCAWIAQQLQIKAELSPKKLARFHKLKIKCERHASY